MDKELIGKILTDYVESLTRSIDMLADISTKVDYDPNYEKGYGDAATAISNTAKTLLNKTIDSMYV